MTGRGHVLQCPVLAACVCPLCVAEPRGAWSVFTPFSFLTDHSVLPCMTALRSWVRPSQPRASPAPCAGRALPPEAGRGPGGALVGCDTWQGDWRGCSWNLRAAPPLSQPRTRRQGLGEPTPLLGGWRAGVSRPLGTSGRGPALAGMWLRTAVVSFVWKEGRLRWPVSAEKPRPADVIIPSR